MRLASHNTRLRDFETKLGNTPLIEAPQQEGCARIFAKCEWHNPMGSIKDRAAHAMLSDVLKQTPEEEWSKLHILEYSGGNLGLSLASLCHDLDIDLTLVLSSGSNKSLLSQLEMYGAKYQLVDKQRGFWGVMKEAMSISEENPNWVFLYQHQNFSNIQAHKLGTGKEILDQLQGQRIDAWIASIGTGGTLMGVYEALSEVHDDVELHAVTPAELPYGSEQPPNGCRKYAGSGGLGNGIKQKFVEQQEDKITKHWCYTFEETLIEMNRFYDETGIKIGTSAGANLKAAREVAQKLGPNATVVTVFPDAGSLEEWEAARNAK